MEESARCVHGLMCPWPTESRFRVSIRVRVTVYVDTLDLAWIHWFMDTAG